VLLLGRLSQKRSRGGIARSAKMIQSALAGVGDELILREVTEPLIDLPQGTNVIWHYGDWDWVAQHVAAAIEARVPIVINSTYDDRQDRRQWMAAKLDDWDPGNSGFVYLGVFTDEAELDLRMRKMASRLAALPKTVRVGEAGPSFEERAGICLGEVEKIGRARLVAGIDVQAVVDRLSRELPGVRLTVYNQYGTRGTSVPAGTECAPYNQHGFLRWLSQHRLYVSLTRHETFAMVPAEAQSVGTPVLYRYMPQSLSPHIGFTGYRFSDVDELALGVTVLYSHKAVWNKLSESGRLNALARSHQHVGGALDLALRKVVLRAATAQARVAGPAVDAAVDAAADEQAGD
jgi:glycosyltransferase involved in cell wall biosynthesis